jgi:amino acid transporter/nucleotide-binding universal stress UspA family protein
MKKFETEVRLSREMSLMDATLIGVGAMIGAGIFVLTGIAAGVAGPALILAFFLNGFVALLTAMSYAELGSCYHDAGGGYLWAKEGLPRWNGFISGWMSWFAHAVACSVYAIGFGAYFEHLLKELNIAVPHWGFLGPHKILAAGVAILFAYINFRGASETGKVGNLVTITKIIILAIFVLFGLEWIIKRGNWQAHFTPFMPYGWSGVFKAMGLTFIAFEGYEVIAQSSEEIRNPRKNIPRAVFLSLAIVIPIYLLVAVTALGSVAPTTTTPWDYLALKKEIALVDVARNLFVGGGVMLLFGGLISTMSALNATTYSSSRVAFAMGRDRNFPAFFSRIHPKNFTPQWAILVSLIIVVLMAVSLPIEDVASAADIMFLLLFLQVNLAMIRLRKKRPELFRGFVVPFYPWLSILGILMLLFLALYMFSYSPAAWAVTAAWIIVGLGVYKGYASKKEVEHIKKVEALERIERKEYRILVCLSNPKSVRTLTQLAVAVAKKHNAEILFLHVIEVREGQPLSAGMKEASRARSLLEEAVSLAEKSEVPAYSIVQVSHRISQGIVETAAMEKCNFILIKRKKQPAFLERVFSSFIDTVLQKSPSEVAVLHGELPEKVENILIPFGASIHTRLAIEIAPAVTEFFDAKLHVAAVFDPDMPTSQREERIAQMKKMISENDPSAAFKVILEKDVLKAILDNSKNMDLLLMAGRRGDFLELLLAKSLSQEITEQVKCPVLWLKEYEERGSFWIDFLKPAQKRGEEDASSISGPVPASE